MADLFGIYINLIILNVTRFCNYLHQNSSSISYINKYIYIHIKIYGILSDYN